MTWLLLDAGNTALKWALAGPDEPRALARGSVSLDADFAQALAGALGTALASLPSARPAGLQATGCSVASDAVTAAIAMAVGLGVVFAVVGMSPSGQLRKSRSMMIRSASLPSSRLPFSFSS